MTDDRNHYIDKLFAGVRTEIAVNRVLSDKNERS